MSHASHGRTHARRPWGEPPPSWTTRVARRVRALLAAEARERPAGLPDLPVALRRSAQAPAYLAAERAHDHAAAAKSAVAAMDAAVSTRDWWPADVWGHRALWHFEQAGETLEAVRQARRIGELRAAAGDPASARRYYAEAIDEARDIGAEHEQGLASLGLGRALLELGHVTAARRLASAAVDLLERAGAGAAELQSARALLGSEVAVGERTEERQA